MIERPVQAYRLEGKTAIVTGASRGIGLATALRLVAEGARVCITARKQEPLNEVAARFPEGSVITVPGKSDDPDHRREVLDTVFRDFGRLDILVNNVGISPVYGPLMELDLSTARKITEVNLIGTLAWVQNAYHHEGLDFGNGGSVINLSSVTGERPSPGIGFYGVSKAAIGHLTRTLATELGPRVRVNAVAPAVVKTRFAMEFYEGKEDEVAAQYPLRRLGTPEDVAATVAFLASSDSDWITGQVINVDGGLLAAGGTA
jgi:NAD(P)-dependent dehydrogenase (short-subunit alcohol dehydrogenase family)